MLHVIDKQPMTRTVPSKSRHRKVLVLVVAVVLVLVLVVIVFVPVTPRRAQTAATMLHLREEIAQFAIKNDRLPENLRELPAVFAKRINVDDEWGFAIRYTSRDGRIVVLTSIGSDGLEGGTGRAEDLVGVFNTRQKNGNWDSAPQWLHAPTDRGPVTWPATAP